MLWHSSESVFKDGWRDLPKVTQCLTSKDGYKIHALIWSCTLNSFSGVENPTTKQPAGCWARVVGGLLPAVLLWAGFVLQELENSGSSKRGREEAVETWPKPVGAGDVATASSNSSSGF